MQATRARMLLIFIALVSHFSILEALGEIPEDSLCTSTAVYFREKNLSCRIAWSFTLVIEQKNAFKFLHRAVQETNGLALFFLTHNTMSIFYPMNL